MSATTIAAIESTVIAELATLFATAFHRLQLSHKKALEPESHHAALCVHTVNARDGAPRKDDA